MSYHHYHNHNNNDAAVFELVEMDETMTCDGVLSFHIIYRYISISTTSSTSMSQKCIFGCWSLVCIFLSVLRLSVNQLQIQRYRYSNDFSLLRTLNIDDR